eukprot:TRINITY_DN47466_c0_g1_i3.p1 TRINITY_DN47466_c0_g1~~TRINITY_DN47466_c0_g1_i3.p1  ORF type:complete len:196 (+),score=9.52 TRINITY_DN47466_c0_g1_i3:128-715(+)
MCVCGLLGLSLRVAAAVLLFPAVLCDIADVLHPRQPLTMQTLRFGAEKTYTLQSLIPSQEYEVRVSYPATIPAAISFEWLDETHQNAQGRAHQRRLLNLEKVTFIANTAGQPPGLLSVRADREGVHRDGPDSGNTMLMYNIELAPMFLGVPTCAFPVILFLLVGVVIIVAFLPALQRYIFPSMLKWTTPSRRRSD